VNFNAPVVELPALWPPLKKVVFYQHPRVVAFLQAGMVDLTDAGEPVNGEANWSPGYFKRQTPLDPGTAPPTRKIHVLPWKLPPAKEESEV
jgi:hypothetical protein